MSEELLYKVENSVAYITINREKQRNTISPIVIKLFHEYLDAAEKDANVRSLLITGAGDKCFSAGAQLAGSEPVEGMDVFAKYVRALRGTVWPAAWDSCLRAILLLPVRIRSSAHRR
ncbi:MAG: hypothetical protein CVU62_09865 [Deltaproteobacteria bacterium HGW-Deltaproteobacteria-2]|nr:MAG: hypothetical protein CVU62_09865 [Deltaproteobacteria bacterium HGW-Deltaproteobacteria-2]